MIAVSFARLFLLRAAVIGGLLFPGRIGIVIEKGTIRPAIVAMMVAAPDPAIAVDVSEVERSKVIAGGVTAANLPHEIRNLRRSSISISLDMTQFPLN